jgi:hypothetical protein
MTTRQSINFSTATPLPANGIFAPQIWDDLLDFSSIVLSVNCSGAPLLVNLYQSSDRININFSETLTIYPDSLYNNTIQLYTRFFKLELLNPTETNQTALQCSVIFKSAYPTQNSIKSALLFDSAIPTGTDGVSNSVLINRNCILTIFGNISDTTNLTIQFSNDNENYYDSQYSITVSGSTDFGYSVPASSIFYVRLKSSANVNILAYLNYS